MEDDRMTIRELTTLGSTLVVLGIIFGEDRLIGYPFICAGVLLSVISIIKSRRQKQKSLEVT
jgi:hypothetical protein